MRFTINRFNICSVSLLHRELHKYIIVAKMNARCLDLTTNKTRPLLSMFIHTYKLYHTVKFINSYLLLKAVIVKVIEVDHR